MTTWFDAGKRKRGGAERRAAKSNPYHLKLTRSDMKAYNTAKQKVTTPEPITANWSPPPTVQEQGPQQQSSIQSETADDRNYLPPQPSPTSTGTELVTETVIYVPHTPRSRLKNALQRADNAFALMHGRPQLRFAERAGTTVTQDCSRSDPWIGLWRCG